MVSFLLTQINIMIVGITKMNVSIRLERTKLEHKRKYSQLVWI